MATISKSDLERTVLHLQQTVERKDAQLATLRSQYESVLTKLEQIPRFSKEELDELMRLLYEGIVQAGHASEVGAIEWSMMLKLSLLKDL
jgi:hypothetical protein